MITFEQHYNKKLYKLKFSNFLLSLFFLPMFTIGQVISEVNIVSEINCYEDPECVAINFSNIDTSQSYDLWIWRDIGSGNFVQLTSIIESFNDSLSFTSTGAFTGIYDYCFVLNGSYKI